MLDSFEAVRAEGHDSLLRIEHAQHVRPVDIPRFRALDVIASMQPSHCTADLELADQIIGPRRLASYAWRSFLDAGVRLAFGSDAPVEDPNPFYGLHAAVTRQRADGPPLGGWRPEERITLDEAVHAHSRRRTNPSGAPTSAGSCPASSPTSWRSTATCGPSRSPRRPTSATPWCSRPGSAATSPSSGPEPPGIRPRRHTDDRWSPTPGDTPARHAAHSVRPDQRSSVGGQRPDGAGDHRPA